MAQDLTKLILATSSFKRNSPIKTDLKTALQNHILKKVNLLLKEIMRIIKRMAFGNITIRTAM